MAGRLRQGESGWLQTWDEIDHEWQRLEILLLLLLFAVLLVALSVRFGYALIGLTPSTLAAELPAALIIALVMLSASAGLAERCRRPHDRKHSEARNPRLAGLCWLLAALVCISLAGAGLRYLAFDMQLGSNSPLDLPGWWQLVPIPVMFLVMALRLLRQGLRQLAASK